MQASCSWLGLLTADLVSGILSLECRLLHRMEKPGRMSSSDTPPPAQQPNHKDKSCESTPGSQSDSTGGSGSFTAPVRQWPLSPSVLFTAKQLQAAQAYTAQIDQSTTASVPKQRSANSQDDYQQSLKRFLDDTTECLDKKVE